MVALTRFLLPCGLLLTLPAAQWSLSLEELALLPNRGGHNRFGFAVQLKFFRIEGRFPRSPREVPEAALRYLARRQPTDL